MLIRGNAVFENCTFRVRASSRGANLAESLQSVFQRQFP